jgi:hypothetical protein
MNTGNVENFLRDIDEMILTTIQEENYGNPDVLSRDSIEELEKLPPFFSLYRNDFDRVLKHTIENNNLKYSSYNNNNNNNNDDKYIKITLTNEEGNNVSIGHHENLNGRYFIVDVTTNVIEPEIVSRLGALTKEEQEQMAQLLFDEKISNNHLGPVILRLLSVNFGVHANGDHTTYRNYPAPSEVSQQSISYKKSFMPRKTVSTHKTSSIRRLRNRTLKNIRMSNKTRHKNHRKSHRKSYRKSHRKSI